MMAQARGLRPNAGHLAVAKLARKGRNFARRFA